MPEASRASELLALHPRLNVALRLCLRDTRAALDHGDELSLGFEGGERADTLARKKGYRQGDRQRWSFLTHYDLSTIPAARFLNMLQASPEGRLALYLE